MIKRPHPIYWRLIMGLMVAYSTFMTFILLLPLDQARYVFKIFHPSYGNFLPERSYADDCRVFTPEHPESGWYNIKSAVFDVHFIAHFAGWWFKMMIIRDTKIAWIISGTFELVEISLRHLMPNFWECWWDQLGLDLFGCNALGILLGAWTIKYAGVSRINWMYKKPQTERQSGCESNALVKAFTKLKPDVLLQYEWSMFQSLTRYS